MKQLSLFDQPPVAKARVSDPATSHKAAERMNKSGAVLSHCELIVNAIRILGCSTCGEIAGYMRTITKSAEWHAHKINKRTADMVRAGLIVKVGERLCSIEETHMSVYSLPGGCCAQKDSQVVRDGSICCRLCRRKLSGEGEA